MILNEFANDIKTNPLATPLAIIITAIGFATTYFILLLFINDYKIDRFLAGCECIYRIETQFSLPNGDKVRSAQVPLPLIDVLKREPRIESVAYAARLKFDVRSEGRLVHGAEIFAVSAHFLTLLNPYRHQPASLKANEIYITPSFNRRYLGLASPQGKSIDLGDKGSFVIKGVIEPRPDSSVEMPAIIAFSPSMIDGYYDKQTNWYDNHVFAYIRTVDSTPFDDQLLDKAVGQYAPQLPGAPFTPTEFINLSVKKIVQTHYEDEQPDDMAKNVSGQLLNTLYAAALFVLLTTAINFFNVNAIINAGKRRTLHIKRALGACNRQLAVESLAVIAPQFTVIVGLALIIVLSLWACCDQVRLLTLSHSPLVLSALFLGVALILGMVVFTSHLLYLAFFVISAGAGRAQQRHETATAYYLNRITLVVQLFISGIMVYTWAGASVQNHYVMDADFGYHKKNLLVFEPNERLGSLESMRGLQNHLKEAAGSSNITLSNWRPFDMSRSVITVQHARQQAKDQFVSMNTLDIDRNFLNVWGLETLAGKENVITVSQDPAVRHVIVTRAFLGSMGLSSYDEALNTTFYAEVDGGKRRLRVLRIVDNFYLGERTTKPQPLMLFVNDRIEKYAAMGFSTNAQRDRLTSLLSSYGINDLQTVEQLHKIHFADSLLIITVVRLVALLSLFLMLISAMIIGLSEAKRLNKTLVIMEAVGGSIYTSIVYFLRQNVAPLALALTLSFFVGSWLLQRWLSQYDVISGLAYTYAFAALIFLALAVVAVMAAALSAGGGRWSHLTMGRR